MGVPDESAQEATLVGVAACYLLCFLVCSATCYRELVASREQWKVVKYPVFVVRVQFGCALVTLLRGAAFLYFGLSSPALSVTEALRRSVLLDVVGTLCFVLLTLILYRLHDVIRGFLSYDWWLVRNMIATLTVVCSTLVTLVIIVLMLCIPDTEDSTQRSLINAIRNSAFMVGFLVLGGYYLLAAFAMNESSAWKGFSAGVNVRSSGVMVVVRVMGLATVVRGVVCLLKSLVDASGSDLISTDESTAALVVNTLYYCLGELLPLCFLTWNVRSVAFGDEGSVPLLRERVSSSEAAAGAAQGPGSGPLPGVPAEDTMRLLLSIGAHHIPEQELSIQDMLGKGGGGEVFRGRWRGTAVAVKKLSTNVMESSGAASAFENEVRLWSELRHPNVTQFLGVSLMRDGAMGLVTELVPRGCLYDLLHGTTNKEAVPMKPRTTFQLALDTGRGLSFLHSVHVLHRDVKSGNVLVTGDWRAKLCDFGLSKLTASLSDVTQTACVFSVLWTSPEILRGENYSAAADTYSFTIVLYELLSGWLPYDHLRNMVSVIYAVSVNGERPQLPPSLPRSLAELLQRGWHEDPAQRPPFHEMLRLLGELERDWKRYSPLADVQARPHSLSEEVSSEELRQGRARGTLSHGSSVELGRASTSTQDNV